MPGFTGFCLNCVSILQQLIDKTYEPGNYRTFHLRDIKTRLISAAPYRDRVVHHALCNIIVPIFERTFISDTYANREGYGTHKALKKFTHWARSTRYILQCDIRKYFPSIDHEILKQLIRRKIGSASLKCGISIMVVPTPRSDDQLSSLCSNIFFASMNPNPIEIGDR